MRLDGPARRLLAGAFVLLGPSLSAQSRPAPQSAPITNLRYTVQFDSTTATARSIKVGMTFDVGGQGPVLLSLPTWTPGSYEVNNFARWVVNFAARAGDRPLRWDKLDYDTWRVVPAGAKSVEITFDYAADTLDNAMAWSRPDFAFFNGTNLFLYPEGRGFDFPATVTVRTEPGWLVATGMRPAGTGPAEGAKVYGERNYHDLVDKPFFIGRFDLDSGTVSGRPTRLASYPAGTLSGLARKRTWERLNRTLPAMSAVFRETPWTDYTVMMVFTPAIGGGSALEHQNSHLGIYNPLFLANPLLASITAHEIFHAWNVKRLRPADMVPYRYDVAEPTPWLWVSEGITDYYSDLAMSRGGVIDSAQFLKETADKIGEVAMAPPTALEDASLSTWIGAQDGTRYLYYPKGSLAGFLLDVMIRDASDNRRSLDDVMRELYGSTYKRGRGFTAADWWGAVSRAAGSSGAAGMTFADFAARYVDGREPMPFERVLPLAGLRVSTDTVREPRLMVQTSGDSTGVIVSQVNPGGAGAEAGLQPGDRVLTLGDVAVDSMDFGPSFRARYGQATEGDSLPIRVVRATDTLTLPGRVRLVARAQTKIEFDPAASAKAVRIRKGILRGRTGS